MDLIPRDVRTSGQPMDGRTFSVARFHQAPQHYIKVVATRLDTHGGLRAYQMTHQHRVAHLNKFETPQGREFSVWTLFG
jgi:hypothetical protein